MIFLHFYHNKIPCTLIILPLQLKPFFISCEKLKSCDVQTFNLPLYRNNPLF
jgi:hypothetical protein